MPSFEQKMYLRKVASSTRKGNGWLFITFQVQLDKFCEGRVEICQSANFSNLPRYPTFSAFAPILSKPIG